MKTSREISKLIKSTFEHKKYYPLHEPLISNDDKKIVKLSVYQRGSYVESYELTKDVDYILNNKEKI